MALKDIFNKGMSFISKGAEQAKNKAKEKKQAAQEFDLLKTKSDHIGPMSTYVVNNPDHQIGKEQSILNVCFTINVENAKIVNKLIPIDETILDVKTGREGKTEIRYAFAITDKHLWVLNQNEYKIYEFGTIANCEIINSGIMTQSVKFDDNAFYIDGTEKDVSKFIEILMNEEVRLQTIKNKTAYLCGVIPKSQLLNMANRGVTFTNDNQIVLHNGYENKLLSLTDIETIQVLVNDSVALSRGLTDSGNFVSSPLEARKISVKFVLKMGEFTMPILEQNMMNTTYKREDATYINNYEFAKKIIDTTIEHMRNLPSASTTQNVPKSIETETFKIDTPSQTPANNSVSTIDPFNIRSTENTQEQNSNPNN